MSMQSDINVLSKDIFIVYIHIVCFTSLSSRSDITLLIHGASFIGRKTYYISKTLFSLTLWVFIFMREINENHGNFRVKDNC